MPSQSTASTSGVTAPPSWTTDPTALDAATIWAPDGPGTSMAKERQLAAPWASIMCSTPDTGEMLHMFSAGGSVYLWNIIADTVWKIVEPAGETEIVASMQKSGGKTVQLKVEEMQPLVPADAV